MNDIYFVMIISFHWCNVTRWSASEVSCECKFIHCTQWTIRQVTYLEQKSLPNESAFQRRTMYKCWTGIQVEMRRLSRLLNAMTNLVTHQTDLFLVSMGCFSIIFILHTFFHNTKNIQLTLHVDSITRDWYIYDTFTSFNYLFHTHFGICLSAHLQAFKCSSVHFANIIRMLNTDNYSSTHNSLSGNFQLLRNILIMYADFWVWKKHTKSKSEKFPYYRMQRQYNTIIQLN